jgi:hypothetical protein
MPSLDKMSTKIIVTTAVATLVLQLVFLWTPVADVFGYGMRTDPEIVTVSQDQLTESEVVQFATQNGVEVDEFEVKTFEDGSSQVEVHFNSVPSDHGG